MSDNLLVLPRMRAQHANAYQTSWLVGPPSPMTAWGMAHALSLHLSRGNAEHGLDPVRFDAMGIVHHSFEIEAMQAKAPVFIASPGTNPNDTDGDTNDLGVMPCLIPHLMRGAMGMDKDDYGKNGRSVSIQPMVRAHAEMSLVLRIAADSGEVSLDDARDFVNSARLGGGQIIESFDPVRIDDVKAVTQAVGGGFWVVDRSDLVRQRMQADPDPVKAIVTECLRVRGHQYEHNWLSPAAIGWAALETPRQRRGARNGLPHAYAEPMVGLVQYQSVRADNHSPIFWSYRADSTRGIYFVSSH